MCAIQDRFTGGQNSYTPFLGLQCFSVKRLLSFDRLDTHNHLIEYQELKWGLSFPNAYVTRVERYIQWFVLRQLT